MPLSSNLRVARKGQTDYIKGLREERLAAARKADPKAFDAFWKATYERLFPAK